MLSEHLPAIFVFALLALVFAAFIREWLSPDLIAMGAMAALLATGILSADGALAVFSNSAPITVACMFILSAALVRTGAVDAAARVFIKLAGKSELRAMLTLMLLVAPLSALINNTPVVVVFLPIVMKLASETDLKASRLLIPLSFASIVGGTCTLIGTSTNLLVDGVAQQQGIAPFGIFEITKLGVIYAAIGIAYTATAGRRLLPRRETLAALLTPGESREFLTEAVIASDSPLVGKTIAETPLARLREVRIIDIIRKGRRIATALNKLQFKAGDRLLLKSMVAGVKGIQDTPGIEFSMEADLGLRDVETREAVLMEGIIGPRSALVGRTLKDLDFRQRYGVLILAVHRQGENLRERFQDVALEFGDTLLVQGPREGINRLMEDRDFVNLSEAKQRRFRREKAPIAIGAVVALVGLASFNVLPIAALALIAALGVVLAGCLALEEAYDSIEWKILFLIFGMLALGLAMESTGAAALMAYGATHVFGGFGPWVMLSVTYLLASILTEMISNNAVAVLLTPIAIGIAHSMDVDPRPFIVALMFGASASFATPIGYQTNTYVYGAGGYRFTDFVKIGVPLNILLWIVASVMIPILWPLH